MEYTFNDAIAEIVPFHLPEVFQWQKDGKPEFQLTGYDVTSREYLVKAAALKAPLPKNLNFRRIFANPPTDPNAVTGYTFSYQFAEYLAKRGDERVYRLEDAQRERQVLQRTAPRGDEELGEQAHRHPHQRRRLHHATP